MVPRAKGILLSQGEDKGTLQAAKSGRGSQGAEYRYLQPQISRRRRDGEMGEHIKVPAGAHSEPL